MTSGDKYYFKRIETIVSVLFVLSAVIVELEPEEKLSREIKGAYVPTQIKKEVK